MEISLRTDLLRSDADTSTCTDPRHAGNPGEFGSLLADARQRDAAKEDDDAPAPGSETAAVGPMTPPPPPASQAADGNRETGSASMSRGPAEPAGATAGMPDPTALAPQIDAAPSPENFAALLDATSNGIRPALQELPPNATAPGFPIPAAAPQAPAETPMPTPVMNLAPPVGSPEWPATFGNTVRILATEQTQVARLRLSPEDLGPVDVRITISDHRAEITFAVSSPEAKAAIQQALPQLRETLAENGLQLGDATFGEARPGDQGSEADGDTSARGVNPNGTQAPTLLRTTGVGLIDLYA